MNKKKNHPNINFSAKIKSKYILKQIFDNLNKNKILEIIRYNKDLRYKK